MENCEYTVQLGQNKARNEKEVQALQRALDATGSQVRSLIISVDFPNGLLAQEKLLELSCLSGLESLRLNLNFSLGATSLGILAKVIETRRLPWLNHLSISYRGDEHQQQHPRSSSCPQPSRGSTSHSMVSTSRSEGRPGAQSSSSSSSTSRSRASNFQDGKVPVSWEGFALLAGMLRENLLPRLKKTVSLSSNWSSRNLGDVGVKYLAELIGTGYFSGLKELDLEDNLIGSAGMEALARAFRGGANLAGLEILNLNKNVFHASVIGIMEIVRVVAAGDLPSLKWIGLSGAGHQALPYGGSLADEIVAVFTKNTSLTMDLQIDWPDRILRSRWKAILGRNLKLTRIMQELGGREEVPVTNGQLLSCGFPVRAKPTLCTSLWKSKFGAFIHKERKLRQQSLTRELR